MSVKEKAKAFEAIQSVAGESPPPRKKSREELTGDISDDNDISAKHTSSPVPPPRKCKNNGTIRQPGESSPYTERKENTPAIIPDTPPISTTPPTQQSNNATGKKKKTRPPPPPPPRGSSLGRKSTLSANAQSLPGGKKPRPPVPPKPKNYVPKKFSSSVGVNVKKEVQSEIQTTKERADSATVDATSNGQDSKFSKGRYILSAIPYKGPNADKSSIKFFVPLDKQTYNSSARTEDMEPDNQMSCPVVTTNVVNDEEINSVEINKADDCEVCENGVAPPLTRSTFYDLSEELSAGKESPDPLEGLEIEVEALSDDQDDEFSKPIHEKVTRDENLVMDNFGIAVKEQSCSESMPAESGDDSKENVKVVFSLLLEEECSVSVVDDAAARQKIVDIIVNETSADFLQSEKGKESEEGKEFEDNSEWSNKRENFIDRELSDETTEQTTLAEPAFSVSQDTENVSQSGVETPTEDTQLCGVEAVSEKLNIEDTQVNIVEDEVSIEEFQEPSVKQNIELEADSQLKNSKLQTNEQVNQESEVINSLSTKLPQNEPQENREIIVAEPIMDGTFISVSDRVIPESTAGLAKEANSELRTKESALDEQKESERCTSLSESATVAQTDFKNQVEQSISDEGEGDDKNNAVQLQLNLGETLSQEVESNDVEEELSNEEKSREHLVNDQVIDQECKTQTKNIGSEGNTEGLEHVESEKTLSASAAEHTVNETCTVIDLTVSTAEGLEGSVNVVAPVEKVDIKEPESQQNKDDDKPESPSSPEPVPPERKSRKNRQGKHAYENVNLVFREGNVQPGEKKIDSLPRRSHSFSRYETVVLSVPHPVQRVSDDEAIYRVPSKVIPVRSYAPDDESVYSVPCAIPTRHVVEENEYSVPKPIVVQAHTVMERQKADKDGEIYAVPGLPTAVPAETFSEPSNKEVVNAIAQESDNIYVVPAPQNTVATVTANVSTVPPPKPPRMSLCLEQDKKVDLEEVTSKESPKPVPRMRVVCDAIPESKEGKASPSPVPRKGFKTESSESSPSPVPRKGSRTSQTESESATPPGGGSPVPVPRTRLNALQSNKEAAFLPPTVQSSSEFSTEESTCTEDEPTSRRKAPAPPRPPPPAYRISITNSEGGVPPSPGLGMDSDSDSDVGEEETPKGPPKPKTYHIVHEILSTERTFVDALKLVFEECYGSIKSANIVADSVLGDIFSDLENIYLLDSRFLQELEERMVTWEEHERIGDIIKKYGHFLKMYTKYVNGYDKAMSVFQETMKENPDFANLVSQFQASERCHGMILSAYMLKPVQRIPSYRLLLIDYLKHLEKVSEEYKDTEAALKIVSEVATHINESMKKMDSFEQLLKLQNMLVGHPEIVKAGRDYLKEGMLMKLCRKDMQERMFFLLTDVLLYTTPIGANQYKLNKMLPLLGMQVTVPDSPDFVNEFSIISTTRSFTLTASTPDERDNWVEALNNAIDVVTQRKTTFIAKTRDAAGLLEQEGEGAGKLGEKAPVWIPDARVTMCMSCTSPFTLTNRRHHCRACGNVVCGSCSESTAPLVYLNYTEARVCDKCYDMLLKEFHTHEIHVDEEEATATLPPLLQETETAEKLLKKPTKFEMMRRFKSKKTKRKSQIIHPTHLTEVVANQEGIQMSGYLRFKKGRHGWKKCWFVLKDSVLYSYKASSDVVALDTMPVLGYKIEDLGKEGDDFVFQLKHQGVPPIVFKADNETSAKRWVGELTKATTM